MGVGRVGSLASGKGGINCPDPMPTGINPTEPDRGGMLYSDIDGTGFAVCTARQVASPGGGGGYGVSGGSAVPSTPTPQAFNPTQPPLFVSNMPSITAPGGDATVLGIEPPDPQSGHVVRLLDAQRAGLINALQLRQGLTYFRLHRWPKWREWQRRKLEKSWPANFFVRRSLNSGTPPIARSHSRKTASRMRRAQRFESRCKHARRR
jgi:hypothetical protein